MIKYGNLFKLVCLVAIVPIVIWVLAISRTIEQLNMLKSLRPAQGISISNDIPMSTSSLFLSNGEVVRMIDNICDNTDCHVISYEPTILEKSGDIQLCVATLVLSGKFSGLVRTVDLFESEKPILRIPTVSMSLYNSRNGTPGTVRMNMELAQIESNEKK